MKTFGKVFLRIDKMGGLQVETVTNPKHSTGVCLPLRGWDSDRVPEVNGSLLSGEDVLWQGVLYTREEIENIFQPNCRLDPTYPIPYSYRRGALAGRRNTAAVLRLASADGEVFDLQKCNSGEEVQRTLAQVKLLSTIQLQVTTGRSIFTHTLFDEKNDTYQRRLQRLKGNI